MGSAAPTGSSAQDVGFFVKIAQVVGHCSGRIESQARKRWSKPYPWLKVPQTEARRQIRRYGRLLNIYQCYCRLFHQHNPAPIQGALNILLKRCAVFHPALRFLAHVATLPSARASRVRNGFALKVHSSPTVIMFLLK